MDAIKKLWFLLPIGCLFGLVLLLSQCACIKGTGSESLEQARILAAVNAERNRWTKELSQQLTTGLSEVDRRVDAVSDNFQRVALAAREYRSFVLTVIERLSEGEE